MKKRRIEGVDHPPAGEFTHGLCVVNTWHSMLRKIGVADQAAPFIASARERRNQEMEKALMQRVDFNQQRLSRLDFLTTPEEMDAMVDEQEARTAAVAVRADGMRIKQLYLDQLTALKKAGVLPEDAQLIFETSDLPSAYGMTKRDLLIGVRVMFTLNQRIFSHIFHLNVEESPPYWHDLSDGENPGTHALMDRAVREGALDQIMQNPAQLGRTWNVVAFYPGYEKVRQMRAR